MWSRRPAGHAFSCYTFDVQNSKDLAFLRQEQNVINSTLMTRCRTARKGNNQMTRAQKPFVACLDPDSPLLVGPALEQASRRPLG